MKEYAHAIIKLAKENMKENQYLVIISVLVLIIVLLFLKNVRDIKASSITKK